MGKMKNAFLKSFGKNRYFSLKWSFFLYLPICAAMSLAGAFGIGFGTNYVQEWYRARYTNTDLENDNLKLEIRLGVDGKVYPIYYRE